jgi:lincosamide nucleotidyltransferase A/C/D/E
VDLLRLFEGAGIDVWLDGGWAVDAALGEQTRSHQDLDIIVQISALPQLRKVLGARGFEIKEGGTESNFVLADRNGLEVDVHAFVFDETGNGVYRMSNGEDWVFPAPGFAGRGQMEQGCIRPASNVRMSFADPCERFRFNPSDNQCFLHRHSDTRKGPTWTIFAIIVADFMTACEASFF